MLSSLLVIHHLSMADITSAASDRARCRTRETFAVAVSVSVAVARSMPSSQSSLVAASNGT